MGWVQAVSQFSMLANVLATFTILWLVGRQREKKDRADALQREVYRLRQEIERLRCGPVPPNAAVNICLPSGGGNIAANSPLRVSPEDRPVAFSWSPPQRPTADSLPISDADRAWLNDFVSRLSMPNPDERWGAFFSGLRADLQMFGMALVWHVPDGRDGVCELRRLDPNLMDKMGTTYRYRSLDGPGCLVLPEAEVRTIQRVAQPCEGNCRG